MRVCVRCVGFARIPESAVMLASSFPGHSTIDFLKHLVQAVAKFPARVMLLKLPDIADPPDMVADAVLLLVLPFQFTATHLFAQIDRF